MNINKIVAVGLCAIVFGIMPTVANAQYDDYTFSGDFDWGSSYDLGGYDNYTGSGDFDWGSSYDPYSGYDNYTYSGDFDWGTSYDPYVSTDPSGYDNYTYSGDFDWGTNLGTEYEYNPNGLTEYEYNPNGATEYEYCNGGVCATEYEYNPACGYNCATEYEYNPATEYEYNPACGYNCATEYEYNPACGCYESSYSPSRPFSMPFQAPMTVAPPRFPTPSFPSYPSYPTPQPPRPTPPQPQPPVRPTPQPPITYPQPTPINIVNTNTNTNVNTNVSTVSQATPGPIVQYVAPSYPVYPSYPSYPTYPIYQNQAPYCVITVGQGYAVGMISLTWSSQGVVTSAYISPSVGQVAPNGSTSLYAYGNRIYTLTVSGPGGTYTCQTQSYVAPIAPVSPYVSLTQIPYTGIAMGPLASIVYWMSMISLAVAGAYLLVYYRGGVLSLATSMVSRSGKTVSREETAVHAEEKVAKFELPTVNETMTRDAMQIVRDERGTPRLVISRA